MLFPILLVLEFFFFSVILIISSVVSASVVSATTTQLPKSRFIPQIGSYDFPLAPCPCYASTIVYDTDANNPF
jgi:hypothetical protein